MGVRLASVERVLPRGRCPSGGAARTVSLLHMALAYSSAHKSLLFFKLQYKCFTMLC